LLSGRAVTSMSKQLELVAATVLDSDPTNEPPTLPVGSEGGAENQVVADLGAIADPLDDPACCVVADQLRVIIYLNAEVVVIAQDGQHHRDEAERVYVAKANLGLLIERLEDIRDDRWPAPLKPTIKIRAEPPKALTLKEREVGITTTSAADHRGLEPDWRDEADCIIREQRETYVYENVRRQVVVRQIGEVFEDDPYVFFEPEQAIKVGKAIVALAEAARK
jgi:hypothetical protein